MKAIPFEVLLLAAIAASTIAIPGTQPAAGLQSYQTALQEQDSGHSTPDSNQQKGSSSRPGRRYHCFGEEARYPHSNEWLPFEKLWKLNRESILSQNGGDTYRTHFIHESILRVASESNVDARLILAIVLQQSHGRASIGCTPDESRCGLLQTPDGHAVLDENSPAASILRMVREGVLGVRPEGEHGPAEASLAYYLNNYDPQNGRSSVGPYGALAAYEAHVAGLVKEMNEKPAQLNEFVNDIANRLVGWKGGREQACPRS